MICPKKCLFCHLSGSRFFGKRRDAWEVFILKEEKLSWNNSELGPGRIKGWERGDPAHYRSP